MSSASTTDSILKDRIDDLAALSFICIQKRDLESDYLKKKAKLKILEDEAIALNIEAMTAEKYADVCLGGSPFAFEDKRELLSAAIAKCNQDVLTIEEGLSQIKQGTTGIIELEIAEIFPFFDESKKAEMAEYLQAGKRSSEDIVNFSNSQSCESPVAEKIPERRSISGLIAKMDGIITAMNAVRDAIDEALQYIDQLVDDFKLVVSEVESPEEAKEKTNEDIPTSFTLLSKAESEKLHTEAIDQSEPSIEDSPKKEEFVSFLGDKADEKNTEVAAMPSILRA